MRHCALILFGLVVASAGPGLAKEKAAFDTQRFAIFQQAYAEACTFSDYDPPAEERVETFTFTYTEEWDETETPQTVTVYQYRCFLGAYNMASVFFIDDEIEGFRPLSFAQPQLDIVYSDPDDVESPVESVGIGGYEAVQMLINAEVDEAAGTITSFSRWRGLSDASSSATYAFDGGRFVLRRYDVDASYDGEMNPSTLVDFEADQGP